MKNNQPAQRTNATLSNGPLQPGCIRLVKLKTEGRLQKGDIIETLKTGKCVVELIQTAQSIVVKSAAGKYFNISGLALEARVVTGLSAS